MSDNTNKAAYLSIKLLKELSLTKSPAITCLLGKPWHSNLQFCPKSVLLIRKVNDTSKDEKY